MPKECASGDCQERLVKGTPFSFHHFPKDPKIRLQWAINVNRKVPGTGKLWMPHDHDVVCSKHFTQECFTMQTRICKKNGIPCNTQLVPDAVPTIFCHNEEKRKRQEAASDRRSRVANKRQKQEYLEQVMMESELMQPTEKDEVMANKENVSDLIPTMTPEATLLHEDFTTPLASASFLPPCPSPRSFTNDAAVQVMPTTVSVKQQTTGPIAVYKRQLVKSKETQCHLDHTTSSTQTDSAKSASQSIQTDIMGIIFSDLAEDSEDTPVSSSDGEDDPDWETKQSHSSEALEDINSFKERKYIVFESQLLVLLGVCRHCAKPCQTSKTAECGTSVAFSCECECGSKFIWHSQPFSKTLPLGNLVLAAAAFFAACSPSRLINSCLQANIACFSLRTFHRIQEAYLLPAVRNVWKRCQEGMFGARKGKSIKVAGDGRCDSPGHCDKYGSYTFMDAATSEVLHCELIQSNQVKNSHAMELEGLRKGLHNLCDKISISHLITDRHASVKKYMGEFHSRKNSEKPITHHFDIWHMAKGIRKKIEAAGHCKKNASCSLVKEHK